MGLRGDAAIVGIAEMKPARRPEGPFKLALEQWADLAKQALEDAGIAAGEVNGIISSSGVQGISMFVPATISEYLGAKVNFAEVVDLGGATAVGMVWRAAAFLRPRPRATLPGCAAPPRAGPPARSRCPRRSCRRRARSGRRPAPSRPGHPWP